MSKDNTVEQLRRMRDLLDRVKDIDDVIPEHAPTIYVQLLKDDAKVPTKANETDAGWDLYAIEDVTINGGERKTVKTGIAMEIPRDHVGLIWPRSGLAVKQGVDVLAGVIDSGYRGEIMVCLHNTDEVRIDIKKGDRIAQMLFHPVPHFVMDVVPELNNSDRGVRGFGSSGL